MEEQDRYVGYAEASIGIGLVLGPVLGSFIFNFTGFMLTYVSFGVLLASGALMIYVILPNRLNFDAEKDITSSETISEDKKEVSYSMFIFNFKSLSILLGCINVMLFANF